MSWLDDLFAGTGEHADYFANAPVNTTPGDHLVDLGDGMFAYEHIEALGDDR